MLATCWQNRQINSDHPNVPETLRIQTLGTVSRSAHRVATSVISLGSDNSLESYNPEANFFCQHSCTSITISDHDTCTEWLFSKKEHTLPPFTNLNGVRMARGPAASAKTLQQLKRLLTNFCQTLQAYCLTPPHPCQTFLLHQGRSEWLY